MTLKKYILPPLFISSLSLPAFEVLADNFIQESQSVKGSLCVGATCTDSESYNNTTIRLNDYNNAIDFIDASNPDGTFPHHNWRLQANGESEFDESYFSIEDITNSIVPFRIDAGANHNALTIASNGSVIIGNPFPNNGNDLQVESSNTPAIALVQNANSGWSPADWEISANETSFLIRDNLSNISPFIKIKRNSKPFSIVTDENGTGINTELIEASFHVKRMDSSEDAEVAVFENNGDSRLLLMDSSKQHQWEIGTDSRLNSNFFSVINADNRAIGMALFDDGSFQVGNYQDGRADLILTTSGDLNIQGTLIESSSKSVKENFVDIDVHDVLDKVVSLKISRWNYIADDSKKQHIGPMAEDFYAAFAVGSDPAHVSTVDKDGVAFASIQALNAKADAKDLEIKKLQQQVAELKNMLDQLISSTQSN